MFVWQGMGFFAVLLPVTCYVLVVKVCQGICGAAYTNTHSWPGALGTLLGAGAVWLLAKRLDTPGRMLMDTATRQQVMVKKRHTLFFVPMLYMAGILALVAVGMLVFKGGSPL